MLHSKLAIIDERFVTIGSYNLDEGLRKNLEANIAVVDPAVRGQRDALVRARPRGGDAGRSRRLGKAVGRPARRRVAQPLTARGLW